MSQEIIDETARQNLWHEEQFARWKRQDEMLDKRFEQAKDMDSAVFVEIPAPDIQDVQGYRRWLCGVELKWMEEFNGNNYYNPGGGEFYRLGEFSESCVGGEFKGFGYIPNCKLFRFDGTFPVFSESDWRNKRGLWLRDHYSRRDVAKVHIIADNLCEFLSQERIEHRRYNFNREREIIP
jgi:hypothetical protein